MKILAIDPGTKCGWALSPLESGVWDLSPKRHEGAGMRFVRLRKYLKEVLPGVGMVAYEEVRGHKGTDAAHIYGGIVAIISEICEAKKIPYCGIPVGTIKKHATGKGNVSKDKMISSAAFRWPEIQIIDDNHADALWIFDYVQGEYGERLCFGDVIIEYISGQD